ncbi:MAG TPA: DNRLRE domain-containing protein [Planctomycetota bacterium]|nr:DNRLRE domain-containing protein [Planctomycetota bacterium]
MRGDEVLEVASRFLDGQATPQELERLADTVRGDGEARELLAELVAQHGATAWIVRGKTSFLCTPAPRRTRAAWIAIPVAACLGIVGAVALLGPNPATPGASVTVAFQDGRAPDAAYEGTRDTRITDKTLDSMHGEDALLEVEGSDEPGGRPSLLRWDVSAVPRGSRVVSARVELSVRNTSQGMTCEIRAAERPWSEIEANWGQAAEGRPWQVLGARGAEDRGEKVLGSFTPARGTVAVELDAAVVQRWVDDPSRNHGLVLTTRDRTSEFYFEAREVAKAERRPRLVVTYERR